MHCNAMQHRVLYRDLNCIFDWNITDFNGHKCVYGWIWVSGSTRSKVRDSGLFVDIVICESVRPGHTAYIFNIFFLNFLGLLFFLRFLSKAICRLDCLSSTHTHEHTHTHNALAHTEHRTHRHMMNNQVKVTHWI